MRRPPAVRTALVVTTAAAGAAIAGRIAVGLGWGWVARTRNPVAARPPYAPSDRARELHGRLAVVDLHADSLLWGRDLLDRAETGHVDVPRLIEGGVALEVMAVTTHVPRGINLERNDDRTDDVTLVALAQGWPPATWRSRLARALHQAGRLRSMAERSAGRLTLIDSRADLDAYLGQRALNRSITAALLSIEGAHALDGDPANVDRLADAGFRMMSPTHFFDNPFGGSAHGVEKGGLTGAGREMIARMERRGMVVDVAHASRATIDDVLAVASRPVIASHTGVCAAVPSTRNLVDDHVRAIAASGGLVGIGFWPTACGGTDAGAIARSIAAAVSLAGIEHVGLGSDFDGAVPVPFDATGMALLTEALLAEGFDDAAIGAIMGGNAIRVLRETLPEA